MYKYTLLKKVNTVKKRKETKLFLKNWLINLRLKNANGEIRYFKICNSFSLFLFRKTFLSQGQYKCSKSFIRQLYEHHNWTRMVIFKKVIIIHKKVFTIFKRDDLSLIFSFETYCTEIIMCLIPVTHITTKYTKDYSYRQRWDFRVHICFFFIYNTWAEKYPA